MENSRKQKKHNSSSRTWEVLGKDVLLTIYRKLHLKDLIMGAPLCCASWYNASKDSSLWRDVDLQIVFDSKPISPSQLVELVTNRSQGSLTSITFPSHASADDLLIVAERCPSLKHFNLRLSEQKVLEGKKTISMSISKMNELEGMEVDEVFIFDDSTLKKISQCCPSFINLKVYNSVSKNTASLIATLLPKLKILDLSSTTIHRKDVLHILEGCVELENLDLTGCGKIHGKDEILKIGLTRLKEFKWDNEVNDSCSECEENIEECDLDDFFYKWPCEHVCDYGYSTYIDGTLQLQELANYDDPFNPDVDWHSPPHVDFDYGASNQDYYDFECDCCYGSSSSSTKAANVGKNNWDYSRL